MYYNFLKKLVHCVLHYLKLYKQVTNTGQDNRERPVGTLQMVTATT